MAHHTVAASSAEGTCGIEAGGEGGRWSEKRQAGPGRWRGDVVVWRTVSE